MADQGHQSFSDEAFLTRGTAAGHFSGIQQNEYHRSTIINLNSSTEAGEDEARLHASTNQLSQFSTSNTMTYSTYRPDNSTTLSNIRTSSNTGAHLDLAASTSHITIQSQPTNLPHIHHEGDNNLITNDNTSYPYDHSQMNLDNLSDVQRNHIGYVQYNPSYNGPSAPLDNPTYLSHYIGYNGQHEGQSAGPSIDGNVQYNPSLNGSSAPLDNLNHLSFRAHGQHEGQSAGPYNDGNVQYNPSLNASLAPLDNPNHLSFRAQSQRGGQSARHSNGSDIAFTSANEDGASGNAGLGQSRDDHEAPAPHMDGHTPNIDQGEESGGEAGEPDTMDLDQPPAAIDNLSHAANEGVEAGIGNADFEGHHPDEEAPVEKQNPGGEEAPVEEQNPGGEEAQAPAVRPIEATARCVKKHKVNGVEERCNNTVWQPGASKCLECLLNKVSERLEELIAHRHARGIWCCTGCYWAAVPSRRLCDNCREKGARMRENRRLRQIAEAEAAAAAVQAAAEAEAAAVAAQAAYNEFVNHDYNPYEAQVFGGPQFPQNPFQVQQGAGYYLDQNGFQAHHIFGNQVGHYQHEHPNDYNGGGPIGDQNQYFNY
ncbi:hypothetical protein B0T20DRAFT_478789 [Sordaria brevicollis]|uniref:Uncharacterized protein n=1 Tax=Sordaria brevicollis TaxID=83679 RepID=A0AAE0PGM0_SORBR|nr:hypothetical protein B0T20DRAFT_478789 [Sordaria brevicollis]